MADENKTEQILEAEKEESSIESEDESEDGESEEESEGESDEEREPALRYQRIGNDLTSILSRDASSCMAVTDKFLVLGTHWGQIHILDLEGNKIESKEKLHTTTVNQISIDARGDFIASCSDDGKVMISGLYSTDQNQLITYDRPIKAVCIDPLFHQSGHGRRFVTGTTRLELNTKGFLGRSSTILHEGEGPIRNIKWSSTFIAWANDEGVKVYDLSTSQRITYISKDRRDLRPELYRCHLCWKNSRTLLIGWGNSIKICVVKDRPFNDQRELPSRYVEIVGMCTDLEYMVCGIAPYQEDLVLLTFDESEVKNQRGKFLSPRPQLRIVQLGMNDIDELSNDALAVRGFNEYRCNDYRFECLLGENMYFVISPKDIVLAKKRDQDDHISWLLEFHRYEEALRAVDEHIKELKTHSQESVGRQYLDWLLENDEFDRAGQLCIKLLGKKRELWENEVYKFAKLGHLADIAKYLPLKDPMLSPSIYEMVLNDFLQKDEQKFHTLIREWPSEIYSINAIVNAVGLKLERDRSNTTLLRCMAHLFKYDKRYDKALGTFIRLRDDSVFEMINKHNLFGSINDKIIMLMDLDKTRAVNLLLDNTEKIPVAKVVEQLDKVPALLHVYLDKLFRKDPLAGQEFHPRQVRLYAEYDRPRLLSFLRSSSFYPLQKALEECEVRGFTKEMVFLLGRMGNTKQALQLIMTELEDVDGAIEFCKEHSDKELWEDLIAFSINKPHFITGLLHNIGTHVDPIILIRRIREGMEIPGLRDSLVRILQDYNLQISLRDGCKNILVCDCHHLLKRQVRTQRRGISVASSQRCQSCQQNLISQDARYMSNVVVFFCQHTFHEDCLPAHNLENCMLCNAQRRGPGLYSSDRR